MNSVTRRITLSRTIVLLSLAILFGMTAMSFAASLRSATEEPAEVRDEMAGQSS